MKDDESNDDRRVRVDRRVVDRTFLFAGLAYVIALILLAFGEILVARAGGDQKEWQRVLDYIQLWSISVPPIIVLFGLYRARDDMRDAVAGATITAFIVILCEAVTLNLGKAIAEPNSLREAAITNFMALVVSISLFYFGSEAVIRYGDARAREADAKAEKAKAEATTVASGLGNTAAVASRTAPADPEQTHGRPDV
jgi:CBS domain containing-hemolysin-like protein